MIRVYITYKKSCYHYYYYQFYYISITKVLLVSC